MHSTSVTPKGRHGARRPVATASAGWADAPAHRHATCGSTRALIPRKKGSTLHTQLHPSVTSSPGDATRPTLAAERPEPLARLPTLLDSYRKVRQATEALCKPLAVEDYVIQSMPDASPTKWHLAHTSWFFEEFVLQQFVHDYGFHDPDYRYLFNSYYETVGPRQARPRRGLLS